MLPDHLLESLARRHPALPDYLRAAIELMNRAGGIHLKLAAHALREFGLFLPEALNVETEPRERTIETIRRLAERWKAQPELVEDRGVLETSSSDPVEERRADVPASLYRDTRSALDAITSEDDFIQIVQAIVRALDPLADAAYHETVAPSVRHWAELHRWFVGRCHHRDLDALERHRDEFLARYKLYETSLLAMFGPAIETLPELAALAKDLPTATNVERALALLKKVELRHRFFQILEPPEWLPPLKDAGFFKAPYGPRPQGKFISFPVWPPAQYLTRIAGKVPTEVASLIRDLADIDNQTIRAEFVEAALAMPAADAKALTPVFRGWLRTPQFARVPLLLGKLGAKLAREGEPRDALKLLGALLSFDPPAGERKHFRQVRPRLDRYEYEIVLKEIAAALLEVAGLDLLDTLCKCLVATIREENGPSEDDHSWIWMRDLGSEVEYSNGAKEALAAAIMRASTVLVTQDAERVNETIARLRREHFLIFRRIELRALAVATNGSTASRERLLDKEMFGSESLRLDYDFLLAGRWRKLDEGDRQTILAWIKEGTDLAWLVEEEMKIGGLEQAEEVRRAYLRKWQLSRLLPIAEFLDRDARALFDELKSSTEPLPAPFSMEAVWVGPTTPLTTEALAGKSPLEVTEFLRTWQPDDGFREDSREGLARSLTPTVAGRPQEWSAAAREFERGIDPTYVRSFILGFEEAARENQPLDWSAILDLCLWVMSQPRELSKPRGRDEDPDWGWTRRTIASLLQSGLHRGLGLPFGERQRVWTILEALGRDPSPSAEEEGPFGEDDPRDPATVAINSVRGVTLHAVVEYALWCVRNLRAPGGSSACWLDLLPEVREYLMRTIDPEREPSVAVRSALTQYLPNLSFLDRSWLEDSLERIFTPFAPIWDTYLLYSQIHAAVVPLLLPFYIEACRRIGGANSGAKLNDPERHLAEHVLLLEAHFANQDSRTKEVVDTFYEHASGPQRTHVIGFAGWYVETSTPLTADALERIMTLVEARVNAAVAAGDSDELVEFAVLFNSDAFPDTWLIALAKLATPLTPGHAFEYRMPERIAAIADSNLAGALDVLDLVSRKGIEPMDIHMWSEPGEKILRLGLAQGGSPQLRARMIINNFTEQGYGLFERLL